MKTEAVVNKIKKVDDVWSRNIINKKLLGDI
jgi:hypothetical protein